ncbi:MAG: NAD-dependent epimerase/dehydratase family protein [Candidatus Magasanikbacteria bacterium]|nr:NAD-dependent epimerase/dehydratase family protein [Candidatus Magasanikbacteria bacterium]
MKVIVTGSSGMIGTRLCEKLLGSGHTVIGIDKKHNNWNPEVDKVTYICNLLKGFKIKGPTLDDVDCIIHLAANARVYNSVINPVQSRDNFEMTFTVLEFARKNGIKKIIFSSSREVYGNLKKRRCTEKDILLEAIESPYSATKIACEVMIQAYRRCYGINFIILRFSNVYGMYDDSDRFIPLVIKRSLQKQDFIIFGKDKTLDFTYIDDTIHGIYLSLIHFDFSKNKIFNISSGKGTSLSHVFKRIQSLMNFFGHVSYEENRTGEVVTYVGNITKAKKILGYSPMVPVDGGLRSTIGWYQNFYKKTGGQ